MPAAKEAPRAARWWVEGCGAVCGALRGARKCGCGGHLGLQGWCRAMGMGCVYVWLANAARAGVPLALLGARGGWRLRARGGVHLHGSRGGALGGGSSQLPPWWPRQSRPDYAERAAPPQSASSSEKNRPHSPPPGFSALWASAEGAARSRYKNKTACINSAWALHLWCGWAGCTWLGREKSEWDARCPRVCQNGIPLAQAGGAQRHCVCGVGGRSAGTHLEVHVGCLASVGAASLEVSPGTQS